LHYDHATSYKHRLTAFSREQRNSSGIQNFMGNIRFTDLPFRVFPRTRKRCHENQANNHVYDCLKICDKPGITDNAASVTLLRQGNKICGKEQSMMRSLNMMRRMGRRASSRVTLHLLGLERVAHPPLFAAAQGVIFGSRT
jgi:hypothetical protein